MLERTRLRNLGFSLRCIRWATGYYADALSKTLGHGSDLEGFDKVLDLTKQIAERHAQPSAAQAAGIDVCRAIFPHWIPPLFTSECRAWWLCRPCGRPRRRVNVPSSSFLFPAVFVSWPLAKQSMQINAWGVQLTCQWLLGETEVVDVEMDGGRLGKGNGLLIKVCAAGDSCAARAPTPHVVMPWTPLSASQRCRYLEESGCASVCINMCKVPTQEYFRKYMGVPLTMQPNYDDYSCLASFGRTPPAQQEDPGGPESPCGVCGS